MRKVKVEVTTEIVIKNIYGFIQRKVTPFGTGAKVFLWAKIGRAHV